jgi:hypothetical protein
MTSSPERTLWPALTLAFLAPFIGEVLTGSTRLSFLFVFIPEVMVWGCGVLLIREAVRHWRGGTTSLILMGLALAVAEEWVIQQTSLAPFAWSIASGSYGRLWGVNWIWFLGMLGYECIWITVVPVAVTELLFRKQRDESWLGPVGRVVTSLIFLIGSLIAWFLWTHIARPKTYHVPVYQPPATQILLGIGIVASLITAAYLLRKPRTSFLHTWKMPVWAGVILALLLASPWFRLIGMMFTRKPVEPFWLVLILGCIWAALAWTLLRWVASVPDWTDMHRWALAFGALLASMTWGFSGSSAWHKPTSSPRSSLISLRLSHSFCWLLACKQPLRKASLMIQGLRGHLERHLHPY